ncbi:MAG: hypothetical protein ABIR18_15335 [Chitinophagaceae bacterium]
MAEENFSPKESLKLIQSMIDKTKDDMSNNGIEFLVWGWLTFIACTGQFLLKHVFNNPRHYYVWWLTVVGIIFSIYHNSSESKRRKVKTYVSESIKYLWIGMGLAYFVLSMILAKVGWENVVFPFFIMLYGLGTFVSGSIIKFRPLVLGGIGAFILAIVSSYASYDYQMLYASGAMLISYIIPAYILRARQKPL